MPWDVLTCITLILLTTINPTLSTMGSIGQPCTSVKDCQSISVLLTCENSLCACIDDADVHLDETRGQCVVQEESSCYREGPEFDNKFHYVPCISTTVCGLVSKTCECEEGYYSQGNGSCSPQKSYGQPCRPSTNLTECDAFRFFKCTPEGICGCGEGMKYHKTLDTCFLPLGSPCKREKYFHNPTFPGRYDACPLQAECYSGVCLCPPGFKPSSDGNCHLDFGQPCGVNNICSDIQFVCHSGICQCKYPLHQQYDGVKRECVSIVPGPCADGGTACVPNAKCVKGQCRCEQRYRQNGVGHCVKPYSYDCELDAECDNTVTTLACVNNQCSCPDLLQKYDREEESCLGKVGARCALVFASRSGRNSSCVEGAECRAFGPGEQFGGFGECHCLENFERSEDGGCSSNGAEEVESKE